MKLAIVMDRYDNPYAGTESQVLKLLEGLQERGWNVRFAVFRETDYSRSDAFPVEIEHLGVSSISNPRSWWAVYCYARGLAADGYRVVHVFFNDASVICPPMMRLAGVKTLISRRDMGFWYSGLYLRALRLTDRFVHGVVCNSKAVAEITARVEGIPESKLYVIYNGYPNDLQNDASNQNELASPAEQEQPCVIGIVANLRPIKRISDLIEAVARLREIGRKVELWVVGGGNQESYRERAEELGIAHLVKFLGSQPEPARFIREFDIAALCSETEGFSNAIIEYLRCGKPVVCSHTGGNPEIIAEGVNGYLYDVGDVTSLANRLLTLVDDPVKRETMGRANREQMAGRYSLEAMLNQHIRLYQNVEPRVAEA